MGIIMIRVKNMRKICAVTFILALAAGFVFPVQAMTIEDTIANARNNNSTLINYFFDDAKAAGLGIKGSYFADATDPKDNLFWIINSPSGYDTFAPENALALKAFSTRKRVENDGTMNDWAKDIASDIFGPSGSLKRTIEVPVGYLFSAKQGDSTAIPNVNNYRFALAQFMIMEAMGEYATTFQDDSVINDFSNFYAAVCNNFRGNLSYGAHNPTTPSDMVIWQSCMYKPGSGGDFFASDTDLISGSHNWTAPLTNVSFWAAIGFARMSIASRGTTADTANFFTKASPDRDPEVQSFGDNCTAMAEASMLYPEMWCFDAEYGLYKEKWLSETPKLFLLETQALAILACSRLYQATQKQLYLDRVDNLLASITKYFIVGAVGAGVMQVDLSIPGTAVRSTLINGYSNALLAMALGDLFQVTNDYDYARLCQDIVAFFNTYMLHSSGTTTIKGYVEFLDATTLKWTIPPGYTVNSTKFISTNSMLLCANEMVVQSNKSFWDLYSFWIIIGVLIAVGVIVVIVLINRRGAVGTKLSKTVRGLISEA